MALPPSEAGAVQDTDETVSSAVAATAVGAPGTDTGVTAAVVAAVPVPTAFTAATVNV